MSGSVKRDVVVVETGALHLLGVDQEDSECGRETTEGTLPDGAEVLSPLQPVLLCWQLLHAQQARRVSFRV